MAAMDKAFLQDVLETVSAVRSYLSQDLSTERLSADNQLRRQQNVQLLESIINKINSTHPSIRPRVNTPGKINYPPPVAAKKSKPPVVPPPMEEQGGIELYEDASDLVSEPNPQDYLSFQPGQSQEQADGPQEDYLDMGAGEDRIEEETYEDPTQAMVDEGGQDVYEEPQTNNSPIPTISVPPTQPPTSSNMPNQSENQSKLGTRDSMMLSEADWSEAYEVNDGKKGNKVRVSDLKDFKYKGWLEKLGGRNQKSWQKRYCVVSGVFMYFYEKESSKTYNNRIVLANYIANPASELTNPKKKHFSFKLSTTETSKEKKDYFFRCTKEGDRDQWVNSLREAFEMSRGNSSTAKMAATMPRMPTNTKLAQDETKNVRSVSVSDIPIEQENYETLETVMAEEDEDQEDYIDVNPQTNIAGEDGPEEDYVDLRPSDKDLIPEEDEEEGQENYIVPGEISPSPAIPPKKPFLDSTTNKPLVLPKSPQQPLPALPPHNTSLPPLPPHNPAPANHLPRTDPVIDTTKEYIQEQNGIAYNKIYVLLWDFPAQDKDEISLRRGDLVLVNKNSEKLKWWYGELLHPDSMAKIGPKGLFPASYSSVAFELIQ